MKFRVVFAVAGISALFCGAASAQSGNSIPLGASAPLPLATPAPKTAPAAPPATMPDMSKINPTAGPTAGPNAGDAAATPPSPAPLPAAKATPPAPPKAVKAAKTRKAAPPAAKAAPVARNKNPDQREVQALNWLEANGYRDFSDFHRAGGAYRATVKDGVSPYTVTVNPATGHATPASAMVDRETKALNLLTAQGYGQVGALRPAGNDTYRAQVTRDGRQFDVVIDPARNQVTRVE